MNKITIIKIQNKNEDGLNKKPAFEADSSESRNDSSSTLTSACIIANQEIMSSDFVHSLIHNSIPSGYLTR